MCLLCCGVRQVRARFVERFSMGAPFAGGEVKGPAIQDMSDRWVSCTLQYNTLQYSAVHHNSSAVQCNKSTAQYGTVRAIVVGRSRDMPCRT